MLTWAICWFMARPTVTGDPGCLIIFAMICDVIIVGLIAEAFWK